MSIDETRFNDALAKATQPWNLALTPAQVGRLFEHFQAVVETNRVMNLTRITDPVEAAVKHYADSLALIAWARDRGASVATLLDIGTGAGFPAVPLAIVRPDWRIVALDGTQKKTDFLERAASAMQLTNLTVAHAHSDHWDNDERFDVVAARALGPLRECTKAADKFLKHGGRLIAYKTPTALDSETVASKALAKALRMESEEPYRYELPMGDQVLHRVLAVYRRVKSRRG